MNKRGNLQGIKLQYQRKAPFFAFPSFYPDQSCAALYFSFLLENRASTHFSPGRFSRNGVPLSIQILHTHTHTHTHIHTPHTLCWLAKMASFHARFWEKVKMHTHTHIYTHPILFVGWQRWQASMPGSEKRLKSVCSPFPLDQKLPTFWTPELL